MKHYFFILLALVVFSCQDDEPTVPIDPVAEVLDLPETPFDYANIPLSQFVNETVMGFDNTPNDNPITNNGATLGRVLFYDKNLSQNNTISCASCHKQENSFSDPDTKSLGFLGGMTRRNSMPLINVRFYQDNRMFWDHRAASIEDQVLMPIQDPVEMGIPIPELVEKLSDLEYYEDLFTNAFGDAEISPLRISRALSQFVRSINSFNTKYDEGLAQTGSILQDFPNFTDQENLGRFIFTGQFDPELMGNCASCHLPNSTPIFLDEANANHIIFSGNEPKNIGLDEDTNVEDNGVGESINVPSLNGFFKSPTIRNIELTGPYMHDGRFATLEEVIDHYSDGVKDHPNLSATMRRPSGEPVHLDFTQEQKDALIAFMKTLTDHDLVNEEKYSDPFINQ
ncbi:MAG: cytochrome-c peroxidase [Flavobacteriaceae bacterium]|nr:cytochrome-c peroxidase [Flavobacteriaceae bacterium]NNK29042.1 cytochrome-c peroxidase [Flavobacteriaceae bacterium]